MSNDAFDYIVVVGGSAGCLLANRLSADPKLSVLLLEARGSDSSPLIKVPIGFTQLMHDERVAKLYKTEPEAVVDCELRVHRIEGLRLADASIFPLIPSGNTHWPVVAVAERAADLILGKGVLQSGS